MQLLKHKASRTMSSLRDEKNDNPQYEISTLDEAPIISPFYSISYWSI